MRDKGSREIFLSEIEVSEGETTTVTVEIPDETTRSRAKAQGVETGLVFVEGGTFTMGSDSGPLDERPAHAVSVGSFWMNETEITQGEYKSVTGWMENSDFAQKKIGQRYPVILSDWMHAINYCNARSAREGLTPAYTIKYGKVTWNRLANGYRLPTEAEWEYASKGGTNHDSFIYPGSDDVAEVAITSQTANGNGYAVVGTKKTNSLGLKDMGGNVYEWCWDPYKGYRRTAGLSLEKAPSVRTRVIRGGDSLHGKAQVRCTARTFSNRSLRIEGTYTYDTSRNIGFRVVRSVMESGE
jgi:formylglycine-generating enzyme required for sulfatase activity